MSQHKKPGNAERSAFVDATLQKKNAVLRRYCELGAPEGAYVPKSMTQYRLWEDASEGLCRLGSPNSINLRDSEQERASLIEEASELIVKLRASELNQPKEKRKPHKDLYKRDQREIRRLKKLIKGMASTIHRVQDELDAAMAARSQMSSDYAALKREMDALRRSSSRRPPVRLVDVDR